MPNALNDFKSDLVELLPRMRRFGCSLSGSLESADDLVQASCERALTRMHQWQPGTRLDSWVFTIMRSIWLNQVQKDKVRLGSGTVDPDELSTGDSAAGIDARLRLAEIDRIVSGFPEEQRAVLLLVNVEGYTYKEAAGILDVPIGTVMSRLSRIRLKLAKQLGETGGEAAQAVNRSRA